LAVSLANSILVNTLEADTLIGADVDGAAANQILVTQGDGTIAVETQAQGPNPYDQAQTFTESGVTVTNINTAVVSGSIEISGKVFNSSDIIDDAEDGDTTTLSTNWDGWNTSGGTLTNQQSTVIAGNDTLEFVTTDTNDDVYSTRDTATTNALRIKVQIGSDTGNANDATNITLWNGGRNGNFLGFLKFSDGNGNVNFEGNELLSSWSAGTTYDIFFDFDFGNDDVTIYINGTDEGTFALFQSAADFNSFEINNNTFNSGNERSVFFDDAEEGSVDGATSGTAFVEWDSGVPTDIFEWDVATFTQTLDGETVDVFVAYSNDGGSTWQRTNSGNPITRNYSLRDDPNITPDVDVRIETELSRADTSNNPTLDSAYRSWLV
jgi:hypothetical protein